MVSGKREQEVSAGTSAGSPRPWGFGGGFRVLVPVSGSAVLADQSYSETCTTRDPRMEGLGGALILKYKNCRLTYIKLSPDSFFGFGLFLFLFLFFCFFFLSCKKLTLWVLKWEKGSSHFRAAPFKTDSRLHMSASACDFRC